jgi:EpsI family protein
MNRMNAWLRFLAATALLAGTALFVHAHRGVERLPPHEQLAAFPLRVGDWMGTDLPIQPDVHEVLGEGDFLSRIYRRTSGEPPIDLFLAYFPTQRTGSTMHSPQNCLPGAGWTPIDHALVRLAGFGGRSLTVNRYVIAKGLDRDLVLYWYQAHGLVVASEYWAKFYLVADSIRMNRSDGALVRIITPVSQGDSFTATQQRAIEFTLQLIPLVEKYVPR